MLPKWSQKARKAVSLFFREWNDIDVYVEDRSFSTLKIYNEILSRLSDGKYRVERVFPLGPKQNVIEACREHNGTSGREALYIVDGDLDLLADESPQPMGRLYVHDRYCIENFLVDKAGMAEILYEEDAVASREESIGRVEFDVFTHETEALLELFVVFTVMRKFFPGVKSVSMGLSKFISGGKTPYIDQIKISQFVGEYHKYLSEIYGIEEVVREELLVLNRCSEKQSVLIFVSGKDFLLPAFLIHIRKQQKMHATNESLNNYRLKAGRLKLGTESPDTGRIAPFSFRVPCPF